MYTNDALDKSEDESDYDSYLAKSIEDVYKRFRSDETLHQDEIDRKHSSEEE